MLRQLPDREPPAELAANVLASLAPKEISVWRRMYRWLYTPRTFTISPVMCVPAAAAAMLLVAFAAVMAPNQFMIRGEKPIDLERIPVVFTLDSPDARSVSVIGSFNEWRPAGYEMQLSGEGRHWVLRIQLPHGRHRYAFLVDGHLVISDPRSVFTENDGFGNRNSIILVDGDDEREA
jgi:hypothetical protein